MSRSPQAQWAYLTPGERDLAYNNTASVANAAAIQAARAAESAAFRAAHPAKLDIAYAPGERTKFDLYPAADPAAPCLAFIHGGYWQRGSRDVVAALAQGVGAHGWSVACVGYDITPAVSLTTLVGQIHAALDWLVAHGAEHGIAGPLVLAGHSAGGHLTAMALGHAGVSAGLAISGVFELGPIRDTPLNVALQLSDAEVATLSPLRLPVVMKPMAITYGTAELAALIDDSRALHAKRASAHAPGVLIPVVGANHFDILDELQKPEGMLTRAVLDLLR